MRHAAAHLERRQVGALDESPCAAAESLETAITETKALPDRGALALLEVSSGSILSLVGDALFYSRQPGVPLQPFVYMDAFLRREFTPASMVYDLPRSYPGRSAGLIYAPANPDGLYRGPLNLRDAMAGGLLPPAYQVASVNGIDGAIRMARALGINSLELKRHGLDLLGARRRRLSIGCRLCLCRPGFAGRHARAAYRADWGRGCAAAIPIAILAIEAADGRVLWSYESGAPANEAVVFEPSAAYLVNDILADDQARRGACCPGRAKQPANLSPGRRRRWLERRQTRKLDRRLHARSGAGRCIRRAPMECRSASMSTNALARRRFGNR